ncbi:MAG TPA: hypothetical protein VNO30_34230 [Kofleriaceae bacterium]|nr:hypothetical protein [Kofleriaceae bacterium]
MATEAKDESTAALGDAALDKALTVEAHHTDRTAAIMTEPHG